MIGTFLMLILMSIGSRPKDLLMTEISDAPPAGESRRANRTGIAEGLSLSDLARPRIRNRNALFVAISVGLALFVLVAAAFSVAAESRVVATRSNQLHTFDEVLRSTITIRSQLGSALNFRQLDQSLNTDSRSVIGTALDDARTSLGSLEASSGSIDDSNETQDLIASFSNSGLAVLQLLETDEPGDLASARDLLIGQMNDDYNALIASLIIERENLVEALTAADENLGQLGALATFIIAFFVPTVAMFVYRQITRRQRETIELARLLSEARTGTEWRADLVRSAAHLAELETDSLPASSITAKLRSRLADLDFLIGATAVGHGYTFEALTVNELRTAVQTKWPNLVSVAGDGSDKLWGDRSAIVLLCNDLVRNATVRGAERVLISGGTDAAGVWIAVTDNGTQINQDAVASILSTPNLIDAAEEHATRRLDNDTSLVLLLGRMIAPALGGTFSADNVGTNTRFTLRLPAAQVRRTAAPTLITAR